MLRVLSLIYRAGHGRRHDLAREAIRLTRQLTLATPEPEARGLLALMLLQHARLPARTDDAGRLVTLDEQDRSLWDTAEIADGVAILQGALAEERPGRYQIQAAIAALHADARTAAETDWPQILAWYDDLVALSEHPEHDDPAAVLNRAVAVGHVDGARAGLAETERVRAALGDRDQWHAVRAYLHELGGELEAAAEEYAAAAERATERTERDHLVRRAAPGPSAPPSNRPDVVSVIAPIPAGMPPRRNIATSRWTRCPAGCSPSPATQPVTAMVDAVRSWVIDDPVANLGHSPNFLTTKALLWSAALVVAFAPLAISRYARS